MINSKIRSVNSPAKSRAFPYGFPGSAGEKEAEEEYDNSDNTAAMSERVEELRSMEKIAMEARRKILKKAMEKAWPETPPPDVHAGSQSESAQEAEEQTQWVSLSGLPTRGLTPLLPVTLSNTVDTE